MTILKVDALTARHGLLTAVRDVSFSLRRGEVLGVIGANGAGKTTLFRAIAGVHDAASGSVQLEGADITGLAPFKRVMAGIAMVPEGRRLFTDMSVRENLQVAGENGRKGFWTLDTVLDALPALRPLVNALTGGLSGGQRQAVAIGRALMSNPKVLLLDEVSLGLSPVAIEGLYQSLAVLRDSGETTMILVEQDLTRAMRFSNRIVCMLEGRIALAGAPDDLGKDAITNAYFGLDAQEALDA